MKTPGASTQLRPGMKTLLDVLNGRSVTATSDSEWQTAFALAELERILPWFVLRLRTSTVEFSPALDAQLNSLQRDATIAAFLWCGELKGLLRSFHHEGIPAIPLKGPAVAERIYGASALRTNHDLDILVPKSHFARAQALLEKLEFTAQDFDRYHQPWIRGTTMVELHDDVVDPRWFDFDVDSAWERAIATEFQGVPTLQLCDEDELLFLALHGVRHEFDRLTLLLDIALAAKKMERIDFNFRPEVASLQGQLLLGYMLARHLLPEVCPVLALPGSDKQHRDIEALAAQIESRILTGSVIWLSRRQRNQFHRMLEISTREKLRRFARQLTTACRQPFAINYRDRRFAAQHGFSRTWQVFILRQWRILLKTLGRGGK